MNTIPGINLTKLGFCPACKKKQAETPILKISRTEVFRCSCGMEYIDPSLDAASMMAIYTSSETLKQINPACENYYEYATLRENSQTLRDYTRAHDEICQSAPGKKLLEVGCGAGGFLEYAKTRGWHSAGLDSSPENVRILREKGIDGICSDFMTYSAKDSFDVVVLWDLIEHPQDPAAFIRKSAELLKPGGLLLLATPCYPNLLSLLAQFFYNISGGKILGPAEKLYFLEHTTYFGPQTLSALVEREGLKVSKFWKTETDLDRYSFAPPVRAALNIAFVLARILGLQNRLMMIAKK